MKLPDLLLRADASVAAGTGHFVRSLSLGQAWAESGGSSTIVTSCPFEPLRRRATAAGIEVVQINQPYPQSADLRTTVDWITRHQDSWVALDGYGWDRRFHESLKEQGARLLIIDDNGHADCSCADLVLNQNIMATGLRYRCGPNARLLLGTKYALLSSAFRHRARSLHDIPPLTASRILVTMGGSDPSNQTAKVIRALRQFSGLELTVVIGPANPHADGLTQSAGLDQSRVHLIRDAANMPELMAMSHLAISAAGSTCWELAFMGIPMILIVLADNQRAVAAELERRGAAENLGWHELVRDTDIAAVTNRLVSDQDRRRSLARVGRILVDGLGCDRVIEAMVPDRQVR